MKRGKVADGTQVASFLIIIGLFIMAYMLLVDKEAREDILDISSDEDSKDYDREKEDFLYLLSTSPGEVSPYERDDFKIGLNDVKLFSRLESETINLVDNVRISKSLLSEKSKTLYFKLDGLDDLSSLNLFFFVKEGKGKIYIKFNGHNVFEGEVDSGDIPISLPVSYAKESNELEIGVASSGLFGNSYSLSSIYVKKVFDRQRERASRSFKLSSSEKAGLKDNSKLEYYINCLNLGDIQGVLKVELNERTIVKENVVCGSGLRTKQLSEGSLESGTNILTFEIDRGDYSIEGIEINVETSEKRFPEYNFEISDEEYEDVKSCGDDDCMDDCKEDCRDYCDAYDDYADCRDDCYDDCEDECDLICDKHLILELKFENDEDKKEATITVNKKQFSINTRQDSYSRDISEYINRGSNYIKIIPKIGFEVNSLYVYIEE